MNLDSIKDTYKSWDLNINDFCFIVFFSSRLFTALFTLVLGPRGVLVSMAVLCLMYLAALIYNIRRKDFKFIGAFTVFFSVLALTFGTAYLNPQTRFWLGDHEWGFLVHVLDVRKALFAVWVVMLVQKKEKLLKDFHISAWVFSIYLIIQCALFFVHGNWNAYFNWQSTIGYEPMYNMNLGYELIFCAVVILLHAYNTDNRWELAYGTFLMSLSVLFGSRGLFINILCFVFFLVCFKARGWKERKKALVTVVVMLASCFVLINVENQAAMHITYRNANPEEISTEDTQSRNISSLTDGGFAKSNGRFDIWTISAQSIQKNFKEGHIFGGGVYGDRPYVGHEYEWGYSHNIILEMVASFGIVGVVMIGYMAYMAFRILLDKDNPEYVDLIFITLVLSTKLLVSDSFWFLSYFWAFVTVIYMYKTKDREFNLQKSLLYMLASIVCAAVAITLFVKDDFKQQDFKAITFDEPTVALVVNDALNSKQAQKADLLSDNGLSYTTALRFRDFTVHPPQAYTLFNKYVDQPNVDVEDGAVEDIMYWGVSYSEMLSNVDFANKFFVEHTLEEPALLVTPHVTTAKQTAFNLLGERTFILRKENSSAAVHKSINKGAASNLISIVIDDTMKPSNFEKMLGLIEDAYDQNAFICIVFDPSVEDETSSKVNLEYVQKVADLIKSKQFKQTNFRELKERTTLSPEEISMGNYLRNSAVAQYIK